MDVTLTNDTMRFSLIGGVLDMYFLLGPSPFDVTDQLTQIIGRPALPPYWSLGFMNSKCVWLCEPLHPHSGCPAAVGHVWHCQRACCPACLCVAAAAGSGQASLDAAAEHTGSLSATRTGRA